MLFESIELSKFIGVDIHQREVNGEMMDCISIPIRINSLNRMGKNRVFLNLLLFERRANCDNNTHYASVQINDVKLKEEIEKLGFLKDLRFIGNVKNGIWRHKRKVGDKENKVSLDDAMNVE